MEEKEEMKKFLCLALSAMLIVVNAYPAAAAKKASLTFKKVTLQVGKKKKISIRNKNKKAVYTYQSSAKKTAAVSKKGVITAKKQGKAKITVSERLKKGAKKKNRKVGVIVVTCTQKKIQKPTESPSVTAAPAVTASPSVPTAAPQGPIDSQEPTAPSTESPKPMETPVPTPDLYTKSVMSLHVTDQERYSVDGNTCHVDMQYLTADASGDYFSGSTKSKGTTVIKQYKDGREQSCARYILSGTDADGKKCSLFIEDNGTAAAGGNMVMKPTVITDSETLSWLETADLQGRITEDGNGEKTIDILWNESQTEPVPPREVVRPDESQSYPNEIFTFTIDIGSTSSVKGTAGNASMIQFRASSDCANFKGTIVADSVDTRLKYNGQIETLSARYILTGEDADGNPCSIYVENNGIDDNGMVTEPLIITDNPAFAWVESAKLHGTVSWSPKLTIHVSAAE